jgi:hypothetical protein
MKLNLDVSVLFQIYTSSRKQNHLAHQKQVFVFFWNRGPEVFIEKLSRFIGTKKLFGLKAKKIS